MTKIINKKASLSKRINMLFNRSGSLIPRLNDLKKNKFLTSSWFIGAIMILASLLICSIALFGQEIRHETNKGNSTSIARFTSGVWQCILPASQDPQELTAFFRSGIPEFSQILFSKTGYIRSIAVYARKHY
jgi:hypothetical protein